MSDEAGSEGQRPRRYGLTLLGPGYAWWRPVVGLVLLGFSFVLGPELASAVLSVTVALDHTGSFDAAYNAAAKLDPVTWQALLYLNISLALLVPATWAIIRVVHGLSHRRLTSIAPGIRWRFFWACFVAAVVAIGVQLLVGAFLPGDADNVSGSVNHVSGRLVAMALVVLLTTPLQAMGEEYGFRGYLVQALGALTRRPWVAVVLGAVLFTLAHGSFNPPLFADRFLFGLMAGYLVLRTGGLEAGIALHVWNNLITFGLAIAIGSITDSLNVKTVPWSQVAFVEYAVYVVLVIGIARRMGIADRDTRPVLLPTTPSV
jgi:hypothetical protein